MTATITLDSSGRLMLPQAMRDALHLRPGARLRAEVVGDSIIIGADEEFIQVVKTGKRRVIVGPSGFDAVKAIAAAREEREDMVVAYRK